jgi:hypothetical protein
LQDAVPRRLRRLRRVKRIKWLSCPASSGASSSHRPLPTLPRKRGRVGRGYFQKARPRGYWIARPSWAMTLTAKQNLPSARGRRESGGTFEFFQIIDICQVLYVPRYADKLASKRE